MITIKFCRSGIPVSDFDVADTVDDLQYLLTEIDVVFETSTHLIIDEIRARIKEGKLAQDRVKVLLEDFDGIFIEKPLDENGRSNIWINSEEVMDRILDRLL